MSVVLTFRIPTFLEDTEGRARPRRAPSRSTDRTDPHPPQATSQHEGNVFLMLEKGVIPRQWMRAPSRDVSLRLPARLCERVSVCAHHLPIHLKVVMFPIANSSDPCDLYDMQTQ